MMADNDPRLRLASTTRTRFEVVTRSESLFDVMIALWSTFGGDEKAKENEVGKKFFAAFRKNVTAETVADMERIGLADGELWATLLTYIAARAPLGDDAAVLEWLETAGEDIAGEILCELAWSADQADVDQAVNERDAAALDRVIPTVKPPARSCIATAMSLPVGDMGPVVARILRSVMATAYASSAKAWSRAIEASAETTRLLATSLEPHDLIERTTNGLDYQIPLGSRRLVMIPTVTLRPWTLITDFGDTIVVVYPVSDEHMDRDPDAAPGWLVRFHKALGDEKRLRVLREVAAGGATLPELTEMLGLAKSTVFHHMGILRAAGLVRVLVGHGEDGVNTYQLRHEAFHDAEVQLQKYLEITITGAR
jgi:DNA-binding transcriptional ArsR family regulator